MNKPKDTASDISVWCSFDKLVDIVDLRPNPKNVNAHPDVQVALLAKIIRKQGWRNPIVVSKLSGCIVKGHGRLQAAQLLKVEKVPVDFQDYKDQASELADLMADNRLSELAECDINLTRHLLEELDQILGLDDIELTGYSEKEVAKILGIEAQADAQDMIDEGASFIVSIACQNEKDQLETFAKLKDLGYNCKTKLG